MVSMDCPEVGRCPKMGHLYATEFHPDLAGSLHNSLIIQFLSRASRYGMAIATIEKNVGDRHGKRRVPVVRVVPA